MSLVSARSSSYSSSWGQILILQGTSEHHAIAVDKNHLYAEIIRELSDGCNFVIHKMIMLWLIQTVCDVF